MRIRRKTNECLNCKAMLDSVYNYCPLCGQENTDNTVSFQLLVSDFFSTYFALDSKFAHTFKPFFFKPGKLTTDYTGGKRVYYAHPLRLYLIVSLFYFFVIALVGKQEIQDDDKEIISISYDLEDVGGLDESSEKLMKEVLSRKAVRKIENDLNNDDMGTLKASIEKNLDSKQKKELVRVLDNDMVLLLGLSQMLDSIDINRTTYRDSVLNYIKRKDKTLVSKKQKERNEESDDFIINRLDWSIIQKYKDDKKITDQQIYDSLKLGKISSFEEKIARQSIRINRADEVQVIEFVLKNLPLMMLILIPIFALILKLMYARRKSFLYITHMIHGLHLHSFAYFFYGLSLILTFYVFDNEAIGNMISVISFLIVTTYAYISFLRVYKQHWFKTLVKFNMTGFLYLGFLGVFLIGEFLVSMWFY